MARVFIFFVVFILVSSCLTASAAAAGGTSSGINAVYNFGDSISDVGNLVREGSTAMAPIRHLPYGMSIKRATGRCSDGYLMIDFIAESLRLPMLSPYLDENGDFSHGVNFAVAGATALNAPSLARSGLMDPYTNSSIDVQLQWFKDMVKGKSDKEVRDMLSRSLVMVGEIGGNDYNYNFMLSLMRNRPVEAMITEGRSLIPDVVQAIKNTAKELLDMGANRLVIPGNFPIGCLPSYLTTMSTESSTYDKNNCLESLNMFAQAHNSELLKAIKDLRKSYPHAIIAYADYYHALFYILSNTGELGFNEKNKLKACCGGGGKYNFDMVRGCGSPDTTVCKNPSDYVSWDGIHLTQQAYKIMTDLLYNKGFTSPQPF